MTAPTEIDRRAIDIARTTVLVPDAAAWMMRRAVDVLQIEPIDAERLVRAFVDAAVAGGAAVSFDDFLRFGCAVRGGRA